MYLPNDQKIRVRKEGGRHRLKISTEIMAHKHEKILIYRYHWEY